MRARNRHQEKKANSTNQKHGTVKVQPVRHATLEVTAQNENNEMAIDEMTQQQKQTQPISVAGSQTSKPSNSAAAGGLTSRVAGKAKSANGMDTDEDEVKEEGGDGSSRREPTRIQRECQRARDACATKEAIQVGQAICWVRT